MRARTSSGLRLAVAGPIRTALWLLVSMMPSVPSDTGALAGAQEGQAQDDDGGDRSRTTTASPGPGSQAQPPSTAVQQTVGAGVPPSTPSRDGGSAGSPFLDRSDPDYNPHASVNWREDPPESPYVSLAERENNGQTPLGLAARYPTRQRTKTKHLLRCEGDDQQHSALRQQTQPLPPSSASSFERAPSGASCERRSAFCCEMDHTRYSGHSYLRK